MQRIRQNPLSGLRSLYTQYETTTVDGKSANVLSLQPVWPFPVGDDWKVITYTIVPGAEIPGATRGESTATGLGNVLFNGFFRPRAQQGSFVWGFGPSVALPTRTDPRLGSSALSAGPALLLFDVVGDWSGGVVVQNDWSLGGSGANRVNQFGLQYFVNYNLPHGWALESNSTITADWLARPDDRWTVPVGGGLSKTFQIGGSGLFYNASLQGFYNVIRPSYGDGWTVIAQFQIIFSQ